MTKSIALALPAFFLLSCESTKPAPKKLSSTPPPAPAPIVPVAPPPTTVGSIHTTASGLRYEVLQRGAGTVSPIATDNVMVHYHGTLLNGSVFDSSVRRGEPISFPLNGVIRGWTEGVQLMKVGDKFKFTIPSNLAYGANSPTPLIPPFSTLVFEVELLGINGSTL